VRGLADSRRFVGRSTGGRSALRLSVWPSVRTLRGAGLPVFRGPDAARCPRLPPDGLSHSALSRCVRPVVPVLGVRGTISWGGRARSAQTKGARSAASPRAVVSSCCAPLPHARFRQGSCSRQSPGPLAGEDVPFARLAAGGQQIPSTAGGQPRPASLGDWDRRQVCEADSDDGRHRHSSPG
jgi:hypothetical protein